MKKVKALFFFAAVAAAPLAQAGWYCEAASWSAYGWGSSGSYNGARNRALSECAVRTPSTQYCYITNCSVLRGESKDEGGVVPARAGKDALEGLDLDVFSEAEQLAGKAEEKQ